MQTLPALIPFLLFVIAVVFIGGAVYVLARHRIAGRKPQQTTESEVANEEPERKHNGKESIL